MGRPIELRVGGQTYRVLASADEAQLRRLADLVDDRLRSLTAPGRQVSSQTLVLAAIALANDLEEERSKRRAVEVRSRELLERLLTRVDTVLEADQRAATAAPSEGDSAPDR